MKTILFLTLVFITTLSCSSQQKYKDGKYTGRTQSIYKAEPFLGISTVVIRNNDIDSIYFYIIDSTNNELFDEKYEKHFIGVNEEYVQQCRNDWKGVQRYPKVFMAKKKLAEVDAVSGATWSYNMFKDATKIALEKAAKK